MVTIDLTDAERVALVGQLSETRRQVVNRLDDDWVLIGGLDKLIDALQLSADWSQA